MNRKRPGRGRASLVVVAVVVTMATLLPVPGAGGQGPSPSTPVVRIPFPRDDGSLTPYSFQLGYPLMTLVYDTLLWRDVDGLPQPWLARAVEPSRDGRQLTVRLATGVRWHDGVPLTANDVAFTFNLVTNRPHPRFTPALRPVERVDAVDASTVVIRLRHPSPGFVDQPLADMPVLPAHVWGRLPSGNVVPGGPPMGSGPYRLVDHQPGKSYRFQANPDYFKGAPAVDTVEVPIIESAEDTLRALERRRVDMLPFGLDAQTARQFERPGIRVARGADYRGTALVFNLRRPPFNRPEARRAVAKAIDLHRLVQGEVVADRGYLHPESRWASKEVLHVFDERSARQELAAVGLPPVRVLAPETDSVRKEVARQVALALERAGVKAESRALPREELSRAMGEDGSPPTFEMAIRAISPLASYDPDFLRRVFGTDPREAAFNESGYASRPFEALAQRVATTGDPAARQSAVNDLLRLLATDVPVVPLFFSGGGYAHRASYDGWVFVKGNGIFDKRSFLSGEGSPAATTAPAQSEDGGGSGLVLALLALALLGGAGVAVAAVLLSRRGG